MSLFGQTIEPVIQPEGAVLMPLKKTCGTVLIVDDDADAVEALKCLLETYGYNVDSASDGRQGLEYLQEGRCPCVVILDLSMPVMTGWQFLEARERDAALSSIPVIVVTASPPHTVGRGQAVMTKPVDFDELVERIGGFCQAGPHTKN